MTWAAGKASAAMARAVESMYREWRHQARAGMRHLQESSASRYERTQLFRIYEHTALPGLFHTAEYSMEIMNYWVRFLGLPDDAEARGEGERPPAGLQPVLGDGGGTYLDHVCPSRRRRCTSASCRASASPRRSRRCDP